MKTAYKLAFATLFAVLIGVASWALYQLIYRLVTESLAKLGVTNFYAQSILIITIVVILLIITGWKSKDVIKKLLL